MTDREFQEYLKKRTSKTTQGSTNVTTQGVTQETAPVDDDSVFGFFEDLVTSWNQGWLTGSSVDEAFDVYKKGATLTDEELQEYIDAATAMNNAGSTNEQFMYQKAVEENGGGFFGGMKALYENPGFAPQALVTSLATMIGSFADSDEVAGYALAGAGLGAGTGAAIGSTGFSLGPLGFLTTAGGAITGATSVGFGALTGAMETGLTLTELLKVELGEKEFNKENIRAILEDEEAITRIKNKSLARGLTIGAIEGLTAGLSRGVGSRMLTSSTTTGLKTGSKIAAATTGIEMVGGSGGELLGQIAAGQEIKGDEIFLEGILESKGVFNTSDIIKAAVTKTEYNINGEPRTEQDVINILNDENLTDEEMSNIRINIVGNPSLEAKVKDKQRKSSIGKDIDKTITDSKDRQTLIDLEIERLVLEQNNGKKGVFKKVDNDAKLEENQKKIDDVIGKYEGVDITKLQEQTKASVEQFNISESIAFAETEGKRIGKDVIVVDNDISAQEAYDKIIAEKGGKAKDVTGADGFIIGDSIVINKEVAGKSGQINVGGHELLHGVIAKHLKSLVKFDDNGKVIGVDGRINFIKQFKNTISKKSRNYIEAEINRRNKGENGEGLDINTTDEWLTIYSDGLKKGDLTFNEGVFTKLRNVLHDVFRAFGYNKEFGSGIATYNFMKDYQGSLQSGKLSQRAVDVAGGGTTVTEGKLSRSKAVDAVNEMEQGATTKAEFQKPGIFNNIYNSITQKNGAINNYVKSLGLSKEKFQETIDSLGDRLMNYDPAAQRKAKSGEPVTIGEFLMANVGFAKLDAAKKLAIEGKRQSQEQSTDIGATTKEGDVKMQVEDTDTSAQEVLDEQDMSVEGIAKREAKENKAKKKRYSKFRQILGFETDGDTYKAVLDAARKSLLLAYGKTQKITDSKARVDKIVDLIKKEYNSLNSDLFKPLKDFLGTKEYLNNLRKFREAIVESISTADLVQMEKFTPDSERIFTTFVKKLTKKSDVQDAVNKNLLPKDALNTIDKGEAVNLYQKVMPNKNEFIGFADQPAINPITKQRSGLKGTRKDGFAKRMGESLILDAVMEVRQEADVQQTLTEDLGAQMDIQQLASKIGREVDVKFSKSNAVTDMNNAIDLGTNTSVYSEIRFSKSHREQYENRLKKNRTDLTEEQRENAVQSVFDFVDGKDIPNNKKSKYEKMAMHYTANGFLILPEDGYKVIEAERIATQKKLDPFSFKNPNVLIEKYVDQVKETRTNPDNVKTFSNKKELTNGVTVYDVEDSKQGQIDSRKVIDTHFGKKANPWCLLANQNVLTEKSKTHKSKEAAEKFENKLWEDGIGYQHVNNPDGTVTTNWGVNEGEVSLDKAFEMWESYNKGGNGFKIAFQNGKLIAFRDGSKLKQWWDRMDQSSKGIVIKGKKTADGFTPTIELDGSKETITGYEKGKNDFRRSNGSYIRKDSNGNIIESHTKVNGKFVGERIAPGSEGSVTIDTFKNGVMVKRITDSTKEMQLFKNGYDVIIGADRITVGNLTKWKSTTTGNNVSLMDGQDKKVQVIEGTVMQRESKGSQEGYDRYLGMQGEKVRIVRTRIGADTGNYNDISSATINGVEQDIRVKFSRSANNEASYNLKNSSVKFSKTNDKQRDKTIQKLAIEIDKFEEDTSQKFLYETLLFNLSKEGISYEEAVNITVDAVNKEYDNNVGLEIKNILSKGVLTKENVNSIVDGFKNITLEKLRIESLPLLAKAYNKIFTDPNISVDQKISVLLNFVGIVGRSTRSGKNTPLKTNKELYSWIEENLKLPTEITEKLKVDTFDGYGKKNISKILYDGKEINKYLHTDTVRGVLTSDNNKQTILDTMRSQAKEAFSTMLNILKKESRFTLEEKLAFIERTFLDQMGMMRKTYPPGFYMFGENYNAKNTKLEHNPPVAEAKEIWKQYAKGQISEQAVLDWYKNNNASVNVISNEIDNILREEGLSQSRKNGENRMEHPRIKPILESENKKGNIGDYKKQEKEYTLENLEKVNNLIFFSRSTKNPKKGITILDFDDTLATSSSLIKFTRPDDTKGTLTPEQYASTYEDLLGLDYKFDFSEFNKVVDGKPAPLLNKAKKLAGKFGTDNMFILTARPAESAVAIQKFLKENGLNIPLKNITGLGNSTADAKALWVLDKANEGYNDFYFADDAIQNVKAVQNMLDQIDVKSKVQQARVKFSKSMNEDFNNILEDVSGIDSIKRFSEAKGKRRGKSKGKFRYFVPPSHEDFIGLLYNFMGKGKKGNEHRSFFEQALVRPLNRAYRELNAAKQAIANDYRALIKGMPIVSKKLGKKILDGDFTNEDAIRVYLWDKFGFKIPGLSETDQKKLSNFVKNDPMLQSFADMIGTISKDKEGYVKPSDNWDTGGIKYDLIDATGRIGRAQFFQEFIENADIIFSEENLNKIEAIYGADFKSALKDMLYRVKNGTNRPTTANKMVNGWMDWINGSIGATMFFNARSALLQQLSFVNFMNFSDNNIFKSAARFANQKQFWSDFTMIFNSDYLKQRRSGAGFDVNASEIAREVSGAVNPARAAIRYLLNLGFLPTQMGDSFAIAIGGASFYRNRVATYLKEGLSQKEAEGKAFIDFQIIAEATQQSARPDMISQQQASVLGRFVLAFQNVTSQYARIIKKSSADLVKRRVSPGYKTQGKSDMANVSRIMYYGAVQSIIFYGLQTALFAMMFDDDEKDEEFFDKKKDRIINGTLDSLLKGAGVLGAVVSTVKNYVIKFVENSKSDSYFKTEAWLELLGISPPISIKQRKIAGGEKTANWNKDVIKEMETMDIDNPLWDAVTSTVEGFTNVPLNRLYKKVQNLRAAQDSENAWWQRIAVALGWSKWDVGIENKKVDEVKKKLKKDKSNKKKTKEEKKEESSNIEKQKKEKKDGKKDIKCAAVNKSGNRCKTTIEPGQSYCTIHEKVTQNKSGKKSQCKKIKKDKNRCGMQTNSKSGYCYYHD